MDHGSIPSFVHSPWRAHCGSSLAQPISAACFFQGLADTIHGVLLLPEVCVGSEDVGVTPQTAVLVRIQDHSWENDDSIHGDLWDFGDTTVPESVSLQTLLPGEAFTTSNGFAALPMGSGGLTTNSP